MYFSEQFREHNIPQVINTLRLKNDISTIVDALTLVGSQEVRGLIIRTGARVITNSRKGRSRLLSTAVGVALDRDAPRPRIYVSHDGKWNEFEQFHGVHVAEKIDWSKVDSYHRLEHALRWSGFMPDQRFVRGQNYWIVQPDHQDSLFLDSHKGVGRVLKWPY